MAQFTLQSFKSNAKLFTRNCTNLRQFYLPVWYEVSAFFDHISHVVFLPLTNSLKPKRKCYSWNHSKHSGFLAGWDGFNGNISLKCLLHIVLTNLWIINLVCSQNFPKNKHFLPPDTHSTHQGVRNVSSLENVSSALI